jgi:putative MATE family efflux protein
MPPNKSGRDCTTGSIPRHLLAVATPMLIGNFIQSGYTIVDAIWVGRVVGKDAIGAIAVSFPIIFIFIAVAAGATMATTILISQYFGAGKIEEVKKTIGASLFFALLTSIVISVAGILSAEPILRLLKTPPSILAQASLYLKINFGGFMVMYFSYLVGSILRGIGDSKTPLYFMIVGAVVNAVLDPLLIIGVGPFPRLGLGGAAVASICAQLVATIVGYRYLRKKGNIVAVDLRLIRWNPEKISLLVKIGFPSMLQQSMVSLGLATITGIVNSFGATATAAFGAAGRIDTVSMFPAMSIGMAVSIICGQNIGAGEYGRVRQVFRWGMMMTAASSLFFMIFYLTIPKLLLSAFLSDQAVLDIGANFLRIVGPGELFFAIAFVSNGVINGAGHTRITLLFTTIALWGVRVPAILLLSKTALGVNGIWIGTVIGYFTSMLLSLIWYFSGRWTRKVLRTSKPG